MTEDSIREALQPPTTRNPPFAHRLPAADGATSAGDVSSRRRLLVLGFLLWPVALGVGAGAEIQVAITRPPAGEPIFDRVEIAAEVRTFWPVERVEIFVDGRLAGTLTERPFRLVVDVGPQNREHLIEVVAHDDDGSVGRARRVTPPVVVHEELELDLQQLYLTVTGRYGRRVLDLGRRDFAVRDQGKPQELVTFARGDIPFTAVLLVDGSRSMEGEPLRASLAGAHRFVADMAVHDEAKLLVYADRILLATEWTGDAAPLAAALDTTEATGGTAVLDHLYMALTLLEGRQGRRVVVLLSDGYDLQSVLTAQELRRVARRSQAIVYWVRLGSMRSTIGRPDLRKAPLSSWRNDDDVERSYRGLERTVEESGGRIVSIAGSGEIEAAFAEVLAELREQYALGYYPDPRRNDGAWRKVRVELARRGLEVRTREGYVDRD